MKIDRHNYEEFFILYMDNELAIEDRRAVEAFVQLHPDLKDELDQLLQYKLVPDTTIVFDGKEELLKLNGATPIGLANYEEWMVLYADNELNAEQRSIVEEFVAAHPSLQREFSLLHQSKLQPEVVIFADKASLYRREEKLRPMPWWRIVAAAVLLLGVGITTVLVINKNKGAAVDKENIVKGTVPRKKTSPAEQVIHPAASNSPVNAPMVADNNTIVVSETPPAEKQVEKNSIASNKKEGAANKQPITKNIIVSPSVKEEPAVVINKTNDLPKPLYNPSVTKNNSSDVADPIPNETIKQKDPLTNSVVTTHTPKPSDIITASNPETDDAAFDQPDGKKNKSRGFFRKIARTFEKRTSIDPTDDNKLLVAGLAIKLK